MRKVPLVVLAVCLAATAIVQPAAAANAPYGSYERICGNVLELLPHIVRKSAVVAIGPGAHIVLHGLCHGVQMTTTGNAGGLTRAIARNSTLAAALKSNGWRPDDVVGIQISGDRVDLYVHSNLY